MFERVRVSPLAPDPATSTNAANASTTNRTQRPGTSAVASKIVPERDRAALELIVRLANETVPPNGRISAQTRAVRATCRAAQVHTEG